jgi:hypothetical protein
VSRDLTDGALYPESLTCAGLSSRSLDNSEEGMFAGASPVRGSARGASVVQLRTAIGARLQGTTLVHTSQSGERQVIDFIGVAGAARQSLPLRHLIATCEKPNKAGHFSSHRLRTVENRGGEPRSAQIAIIRPMAKVRILRNQASFLTAESLKPASAIRRDGGISDVACQCRPPAKAGNREPRKSRTGP